MVLLESSDDSENPVRAAAVGTVDSERGVRLMRIAALILGVLGGIAGIFGGGLASCIGKVGTALSLEGASTVTGLGIMAIPTSILGIVGGALAMSKPKTAGIMMLSSAGLGLILVFAAYFFPAILLLVGGILAIVGQKELETTT